METKQVCAQPLSECACGRLGFVTIFHFPVPHALFPLPVLETSSPQVLVLFK